MSPRADGYREECHCGHDRASHYCDRSVQPAVVRACLCQGCGCEAYSWFGDPLPKAKLIRPAHPSWCLCYRCKEWDRENSVPVN